MAYNEINKALANIVERRNELRAAPADQKPAMAEKLEEEELDFLAIYGGLLSEILMDVHDEYTPDTEVMPANHYFSTYYEVVGTNEFGNNYQVPCTEGLLVEIDDYPNKETRLVLAPNPLRIVLNIDEYTQNIVWNAHKPTYVA